jgi:hypothetical protein
MSDQLVARPLPKHKTTQTQNKHIHTLNIHAFCEIRTHEPSFRASEDSTCFRPLGYRDRQTSTNPCEILWLVSELQFTYIKGFSSLVVLCHTVACRSPILGPRSSPNAEVGVRYMRLHFTELFRAEYNCTLASECWTDLPFSSVFAGRVIKAVPISGLSNILLSISRFSGPRRPSGARRAAITSRVAVINVWTDRAMNFATQTH